MESSGTFQHNSENEDELSAQDRTHLLHFLPAEIWHHIVERVPKRHTQNTLENLSNSSPFYSNLLSNQKTTFLIGKVLNILVKDNYLAHLNDVLNCRRVCKSWSCEIDKMLTNDSCKISVNKRKSLNSYDKISAFYTHFDNTHTNSGRSPFIGNKLSLTIDDLYTFEFNPDPNDRILDPYSLSKITIILQRYHNHIKDFSITFKINYNLVLKDVLVTFREWLLSMKNLVRLRIINGAKYLCAEDLELGNPFLQGTFPKLDKLEELHINKSFPEDVGLNIIKNNDHIRKLIVEMTRGSDASYDYKLQSFPNFPNLNHLDININSIGKMAMLENANFPHLSTLTITATPEFNFCEKIRWSKIFSIIETKFGDTLERLSVEMESLNSEVLHDTRTTRLNLPKLKELRLLVNDTQFSLDFIMPMMESLDRICVMVISSQSLESSVIKMKSFQDFKVWNADKLCEFIHFDKSFDEIKDWIRDETTIRKSNVKIIGDKLLLRSVCVF